MNNTIFLFPRNLHWPKTADNRFLQASCACAGNECGAGCYIYWGETDEFTRTRKNVHRHLSSYCVDEKLVRTRVSVDKVRTRTCLSAAKGRGWKSCLKLRTPPSPARAVMLPFTAALFIPLKRKLGAVVKRWCLLTTSYIYTSIKHPRTPNMHIHTNA